MHRCAILDDYQNVALKLADWSKLRGEVEIKVFNDSLGDQPALIRGLGSYSIVCLMRERTPFLRNTIEALPDLKLLITTGAGNKSIDLAAAAERGITVCGTEAAGQPTAELAIGIMLELARNASSNAASSTIGPRDVLMKYADGRISAKSLAPTSPRVRGLSCRCTVMKSD